MDAIDEPPVYVAYCAGLASAAVLTALFDQLISNRRLDRNEVVAILKNANASLSACSASVVVSDAAEVVAALLRRLQDHP